MRSTFQNSGMSLSIGIFFSLMIAGLAATLPRTLSSGLRAQGVPAAVAAHIASLPPVSTLFSALLGYNPIRSLLAPSGVLARLPARNAAVLTGKQFFPHLISGPVPPRPDHRVQRGDRDVADRRAHLAAARPPVLLRGPGAGGRAARGRAAGSGAARGSTHLWRHRSVAAPSVAAPSVAAPPVAAPPGSQDLTRRETAAAASLTFSSASGPPCSMAWATQWPR